MTDVSFQPAVAENGCRFETARDTTPDPIAAARQQTLGEMLRRTALRLPNKTALIAGETRWTYSKLSQMADRIGGGLIHLGIGPGDVVALLSRNSHWFVALRFAVARIGAVLTPVNFMLSDEDVGYILGHSGARLLFVDPSCAAVGRSAAKGDGCTVYGLPDLYDQEPHDVGIEPFVDALSSDAALGFTAPEIDARSIAQILYTSGTESRPKGVMLSHEAILWEYQACLSGCDWRQDGVVLNAMPLFHCAQLDGFLGPSLQIGATNVILPNAAPDLLLDAVERHRATSLFAPPTVWIDMLRSPKFDASALSSLTHGFYGASSMPIEVLGELRRRLPQLQLWNCYGQTEITCIATLLQPEDQVRRAGSAGRPTLHVETRVVDHHMEDVKAGEKGEIVHRSPQLMSGYWNDPVRTAEAFKGGWFHSGDIGVLDEDGFLTIVDRMKDMIKTGGENVSSREVEEELYRVPGVSEAAVVGLPHPRWIEMVTAFVVVKPGCSLDEAKVISHCRAALSSFKAPKQVIFVDALPRNASGKILKRDLRASADARIPAEVVE